MVSKFRLYLVAAALAAASGSALAQITLGQVGALTVAEYSQCASNLMVVQTATGSPYSYTVPQNGTITSWSFAAPTAATFVPDNTEALVILRPTGGTNYTIVDITPSQTVPGGQVGSFSANIAVKTGDLIGLWIAPSQSNSFCLFTGVAGDTAADDHVLTPTAGNSVSLGFVLSTPYLLNMSATFTTQQASAPAAPVPALSGGALLILAGALVVGSGIYLRRKST
jgi:hypothetical protein